MESKDYNYRNATFTTHNLSFKKQKVRFTFEFSFYFAKGNNLYSAEHYLKFSCVLHVIVSYTGNKASLHWPACINECVNKTFSVRC